MPPSRGVHDINLDMPNANVTDHDTATVYTNQPVDCAGKKDNILTQATDPFKPERVVHVVMEVTIGEDLTEEQRASVEAIIREFADCFALSMKEVNAIPGTVHKLNIPEGTKFQIKIPLHSYNPVQHAYLESKIDEMLEGEVIHKIHLRDICFVAQTVLAQKPHKGQGLAFNKLKHHIHDQCAINNLPPEFDLPH